MPDTWIVITSINPPTVAVQEFAAYARKEGGGVVVVGDTKSPSDYAHPGVVFLSIEEQRRLFPEVADLVPTRSYARKNIGYLFAIREGARLVIDTDDDNRPLPTFGRDIRPTVTAAELGGADWVNVYRHFTDEAIWPRGLPLDRIHTGGTKSAPAPRACPIQQFLADEDPDVDAIFRLIHREPVRFQRDAAPVALARGTYCPFNSQDTVFFPEAFPLLYLPCFVSFRMTDIWRSFVAQRVLWTRDRHLSFHAPTVYQERNVHDLMRDFADEVVGYLKNDEIGKALARAPLDGLDDASAVMRCYEALREIGVIQPQEMDVLRAWDAARQRVTR